MKIERYWFKTRLTDNSNEDSSVYHARKTTAAGRDDDDETDGDHDHEEQDKRGSLLETV